MLGSWVINSELVDVTNKQSAIRGTPQGDFPFFAVILCRWSRGVSSTFDENVVLIAFPSKVQLMFDRI